MKGNIWRDDLDAQLSDILSCVENIAPFPAACPACGSPDCHVYYHRYNEVTGRGGSWVWCSHCRRYSHFSCVVPQWWINMSDIDTAQLAALPDYLESKKEMIDHWLNKLPRDFLE